MSPEEMNVHDLWDAVASHSLECDCDFCIEVDRRYRNACAIDEWF